MSRPKRSSKRPKPKRTFNEYLCVSEPIHLSSSLYNSQAVAVCTHLRLRGKRLLEIELVQVMGYCFSSSPHSPSPALKRTLYLFSVGWTEERGFFKIWQTSDNEPRIFTGRGECSNQSPTIGQFSKYRGASKNVWVMKNLSYEKFELWVMLSLCFSHVATGTSPFRSNVFHFLAKLSKIFFACDRKQGN